MTIANTAVVIFVLVHNGIRKGVKKTVLRTVFSPSSWWYVKTAHAATSEMIPFTIWNIVISSKKSWQLFDCRDFFDNGIQKGINPVLNIRKKLFLTRALLCATVYLYVIKKDVFIIELLIKILVCFVAGAGAGIGTGFAGMSAAAIVSPLLITFLGIPAYTAVGVGLASDVPASAISAVVLAVNYIF